MSLSIGNTNNYNTNYNTNFKSKWEQTNEGAPYYKTNSGLKAGAVLAVPAGLNWIINGKHCKNIKPMTDQDKKSIQLAMEQMGLKNNLEKDFKILENNAKRQAKYAIPFAILASTMTIGSGILVDHIRNKKAQNVANITKELGVKKAIMTNDNIELSKKGRTYYDSNVGSKYGALLGAACGVASTLMSYGTKFKLGFLFSVPIFALGGWIMGKIADHNTNKAAEKNA